MMDREPFAPDLEPLLAPVSADKPCGPSIRYDPAFLALRTARTEDDASLPMGVWERDLKRADWRAVAHDCIKLLERSKDLQLAAWLCDAWTRQHHIAGFNAGADLLLGLVERYWDGLHPEIDDGDTEARTAPFVWMNETLPLTLKLQVPLMTLPDRKPPAFNLADWEVVVTARPSRDSNEQPLTRELLIGMAEGKGLFWLSDMQAQLQHSLEKWDALSRALDDRLALDAPSLGKVADVLRRLQRACVSLLDGRDPRAVAAPVAVPEPQAPVNDMEEEPPMSAAAAPTPAAPAAPSGPITSRQEAYRRLEEAAAYLQRTEPHSPTPYLVKRAVAWGQLSLADLMQEIMREEGDLGRFFSLLGVKLPRED